MIRWFGHRQALHSPNKQLSRCQARRMSDPHQQRVTKLRAQASLSAQGLPGWRSPRCQDGHLHLHPNTKFVLNRGRHMRGMNQQKATSQCDLHRMKKSMSACTFEKKPHYRAGLNLHHPNMPLHRCQALHICDDHQRRRPEPISLRRSHLYDLEKDGLSNSHRHFGRRSLHPSMIHRQY